MNRLYEKVILVVLTLISLSSLRAQENVVLPFLGWNIDPAAVGSGAAATADGQGFPAVFYNPALLNTTGRWAATFTHRSFPVNDVGLLGFIPLDFSYYSAGLAYRFHPQNVLSVHFRRFSFGDMVITPVENPEGTLSGTYDYSLALTYAHRFSRRFGAGVTVKFLRSKLGLFTGNSWALDIGLRWQGLAPGLTIRDTNGKLETFRKFAPKTQQTGLSIGLALLNMGPRFSYDLNGVPILGDPSATKTPGVPIPQTFRLGFAYHLLASPLVHFTALFDFEKQLVRSDFFGNDSDSPFKALFTAWKGKVFKEATYHLGGNLRLAYVLFFRYGYQYMPFLENSGLSRGVFTYGFGLDLKYVSLQYGRWASGVNDNVFTIYRKSSIIGITVKNIPL